MIRRGHVLLGLLSIFFEYGLFHRLNPKSRSRWNSLCAGQTHVLLRTER
jgi:hypothetical protein